MPYLKSGAFNNQIKIPTNNIIKLFFNIKDQVWEFYIFLLFLVNKKLLIKI